jgi:hypothetical protein
MYLNQSRRFLTFRITDISIAVHTAFKCRRKARGKRIVRRIIVRHGFPLMNSYPPELLVQLAPVMFVAGLEAQAQGYRHISAFRYSDSRDAGKPQDPFSVLNQRLREALVSQRKPAVWQSEQTKTFQVVIVDRDVHFLPRKRITLIILPRIRLYRL